MGGRGGGVGVAVLRVGRSAIDDGPRVAGVAGTVGESAGVRGAERWARWMEQALGLPLDLDWDRTEETARKLLASMEVSGSIEEHLGMPGEADDFYV